ncbi:MAG: hypothetical protein LBS88_03600 [Tannerellaceae bacterium]|nr:hypothetical protein [Tannerellaceae bacterium]
MLKRPIDLLEAKAIRNPYFLRNVNSQKPGLLRSARNDGRSVIASGAKQSRFL